MTRRSVYGAALVAFLATCATTIASIVLPRWISWDMSTPSGVPVHYTYGLHSRCNSVTDACTYFPQDSDCHGEDRSFCSFWRTVGFLMSLAVVLEGMTLIAFVVMLSGGKQKRESGWRIVCAFLCIVGLVQCAAMAFMVSGRTEAPTRGITWMGPPRMGLMRAWQAYLYDNDERFFAGWRLDTSWALCTAGWSVQVLIAAGIAASALFLQPEAGYELIPDANADS